jgi:phage-related minor tail protein
MDEEIERLTVSVRADTASFTKDVDAMRGSLEGPLVSSADKAGQGIENALVRAVASGKLSFEDLGKTALSVLSEIAAQAVRGGLNALIGGGSGASSGIGGLLAGLLTGSPGRATGGPVSPGRAYVVGENGPELFVPTSSGQVAVPSLGGGRDVRVAITVNAGAGDAPRALQQSSRQVARAVKAAIEGAG